MKIKIRLWVKITIAIIILISLIYVYGRYIDTYGFKVNEYKIEASVPDSFNGLKIVHISDINYLHTTSKKDLIDIVNKINLINPDIVVFTGDLLNIHIKYSNKDYNNLTKILSKIKAKIGKFAINGEEDKPFDKFNDIIKNSNFTLLNNSYEYIYNKTTEPIIIAGINDNYNNDININNGIYSILLIHKPDYIDAFDYSSYNLILAGHSLNGYVNIPGIKNIFLEKGSKKYYDSHYILNNSNLYISNGLGTKNIKFRILNKPSFNFYRINKAI